MKTIILPLIFCIFGLFIAHYFFGVDVEGLFEGFADFIITIMKGPGN